MQLRHIIFVCLFLISFSAYAYELVMIQSISDTRRSFITRNGKRQGLIPGLTGTFTAEDISLLARVVSVSGNFAQWEVINPEARLPFEKGSIVTYYPATEYIWALSPESERRKYIKSQLATPRRSLVYKGAFTRGVQESVSEAPATPTNRGGFLGEIYFEKDIVYQLAFDVGLRYERELTNYPQASYLTQRNILMVDLIYYFDYFRDWLNNGRFFMSAGAGYGLSNTQTIGLSQTGPVGILPAVKLGVNLPFNEDWHFVMDSGFESLQTREQQESGNIQTTTQTNFKVGFGLRQFF
jgi:hypothetical protein